MTIIVGDGPDAMPFSFHQDRLFSCSSSFASAYKEHSNANGATAMMLQDVEVPVFGLLFFWLYSESIPQRKVGEKEEHTLSQTPAQLAKLWVLAARFGIPKLQNTVIDAIFTAIEDIFHDVESLQLTRENPGELMKCFVDFAYSTDLPILRNLAVDRLAWACPRDFFYDMVGDLPKEAIVDSAKALKSAHEMCAAEFYFAED